MQHLEEKEEQEEGEVIIRRGMRRKLFGRGSSPRRGSRRGSTMGIELGGDKQKIKLMDEQLAILDEQDRQAEENKLNEELRKVIVENGRLIANRLKYERSERDRIAAEKAEKDRLAEEERLKE